MSGKTIERRAIVVGGSISGLFAALMLARQGWHVDVFERAPGELAGRGAGIVAQPELRHALAAAGIGDIGEVGVKVEERILLDATGRQTLRRPCPQVVTSWERVHRLLRSRLPQQSWHAGSELARVEIEGDIAHAHFTDGSRASADLLIGADGIRSTVRRQLFPSALVEYAGYVAWRSLVEERLFPPDLHAQVFWHMAFGLPPGEQFIGYPVTGENDDMTPGRLRWNIVWYRPTGPAELDRMLTDDSGRVHAMSIPPPLIRDAVRAKMRAAAARLLAPQFRQAVELNPLPFLQPIYDLSSAELTRGPVAIIGDAAFVARPHVAAGVIKAAEDVLAMVDALAAETDIPTALQRFQTERLPIGRRIVDKAREMGAPYRAAAPGQTGPSLSDRDADYARRVLEDTALTTFLKQ